MSGLKLKYFVVNPNKNTPHGVASRAAIQAYADHVKDYDPGLALDLRLWVERIEREHGYSQDHQG